ncbi:MAG: hypothetical protein B7Y80_20025 [Hyphomicrobium sp. 32-62-53]|nr:MAG: hypothetical protein B7Z29_19855 [Hyphomicrobium sp. 12-62-95]OYX97323.1 MAG: hypothetical protein B7Y80_20025 [Hyphomicrobium sp. 32-62-53]
MTDPFKDILTDEEKDTIRATLARVKGGNIPTLEALDGFLTALVIGPDLVLPSEFFEVIKQGASEDDGLVFETTDEASTFFHLVMKLWNGINDDFQNREVHLSILDGDDIGMPKGNDWAQGFIKGTHLRFEPWRDIANDEARGGLFVPIWALAYEHAEDPKLRPYAEPMSEERREQLLVSMMAATKRFYEIFKARRALGGSRSSGMPYYRTEPKVGRNDRCPCGSGKKYKHCCGRVTIH